MHKFLFFLSLFYGVLAFSQAPTNPTSAVNIYNIEGDRAYMSIVRGNGSSRIVVVKKDTPVTFLPIDGNSYLANTSFESGQQVAPGEYVIYSGVSSSTSITNLLPGTTYHIAVFEFNGTGLTSSYLTSSFYAGSFTTLSVPTIQATNAVVSNLNSNTLTLSWTPGNGSYSMVLAREGSPVNANPVDLTSYNANNTFYQIINGPSQIGVGNFVMYKGTGSSVSIDNLKPGVTYHFMILTYNGTTGPVYLTTNPAITSAQTLLYPTLAATNISFYSIEGDRLSTSWTNGNGSGRLVVVRANEPVSVFPQDGVSYTANANFALATDLGDGNKVMYSGSNNNFVVNGLTTGTTYHFAVFEYAGSGSERYYNVTSYALSSSGPVVAPQENVAAISVSNITAYSATLTLSPGNGNGRLVVLRPNEPTTYEPIDLNGYYASNSPNLSYPYGNIGDGNKVIYKGTGTTINISNAQPNTTYYLAAYEFNGNNYPIYQKNNPALITFTTLLPPAPTVSASNLNFTSVEGNAFRIQWSNGNGLRRMVVMSQIAPVSSVPENGVQYFANSNFSLATEIAPGEKIVYDGNASSVNVSGLAIGTTYYVRIFEYNGTELLTNYLTSTSLAGSSSTVSAPTIEASNVYVQQVNQQELRVYWTNGNGNRKLIIGRLDEPIDAIPQDLTSYNSSSYFGGGAQIAPGQRSVYYYNGAALGQESYTTVYSVSPGNTYHFKVFECNGITAPVYATSNPGTVSYYIGYEPLTPSTNVFTQSHDGGGMTVYIGNRGGGQRRLIVAREGGPVDVFPTDGETYIANANFTLGQNLGNGNKVIYDGSGYFVNLTGLEHSKTYHFAVIEYGGTGEMTDYLTSNIAATTGTTLSPPTVQVSSLSYNAITSVSTNVSWTNGNGSNRLMIARKDNPVSVTAQDYTNYNYNQYFGYSGHLGDGNYVVYKGNASNITLQNLTAGTTYYTDIYEFNGSGLPVFLGPPLSGSFTTLGPPQNQASQLVFSDVLASSFRISCDSGSGQRRLIVVKEGSPISTSPTDNTTYTANSFFGSGNSIGDDTYVVYNGFDNEVVVTGLTPGLTYYVAVYEFNAFTGGIVNYLVPSTALGTVTTSTDLCLDVVCPPGTVCEQGGCFPIVYVVSGIVQDATTNAVLSGVSVTDGTTTVFTDSEGFYSIEILYGTSLTYSLTDYFDLEGEPLFASQSNLDVSLTSVCSVLNCPPGTECFQLSCVPIGYLISGIVRDATTNEVLSGVLVSDGSTTVISNSQGFYSIEVLYGVELTFTLSGYSIFTSEQVFSNLLNYDVTLTNLCEGIVCPEGMFCFDGNCFPIPNPCDDVVCPPGTICEQGGCFPIVYVVSGIVQDATTNAVLSGVSVTDGSTTVFTDSEGFYSIEILYGSSLTYSLTDYFDLEGEPLFASQSNLDVSLTSVCSILNCPPGTECFQGSCIPVGNPCNALPPILFSWYLDSDGDGFGDENNMIEACEAAPGYVAVYGDCDDTNNTVYPGAEEICYDGLDNDCDGIIDNGCTPIVTVVQPSQCGITLAAVNSYVYANIVSGAQGYRFRVTNLSTNQVQSIDQLLRAFRITQLTNYAFNTTYSVEVSVRINNVWQPFYGTPCNVSTPDTTTQIQASQCNTTLSSVTNTIFADIVPFATGYRFRVTNTLNPVDVQTIDRPIRDFKMTSLSSFQYNTMYNVEVAVRNTDGTYLSYGPVCNITTPLFPTVGLQDAQCDEYQVSSNTETLFAESYPGAQQYRFLLENLSQPYSQTFDRPIRTVTLNNFTGLLPGTTYTVRVAIQLNGVWGPYGKSCSIITPGAGRPDEISKVDETSVNEFKAIAYPNPFATSFAIDVRTSNTEKVSLTVYDMAGRLLESNEVNAADVTNYQFGDRYPSGVYNVIVTQGNETRTVRVVKQ